MRLSIPYSTTPEGLDCIRELLKGNDFNLKALFHNDIHVPLYNDVSRNGWDLKNLEDYPKKGYFNGPRIMGRTVPVLRKDGITWMSVVPMECESHLPHTCREGDMLVFGLGLGYVVYNMYYGYKAYDITVVEKDQDVIDLFYEATDGIDSWECIRDEMEIIHADAFEVEIDRHFDHVYVDIWSKMFDDNALSDVRKICSRLPSFDTVSWWTMEVDLISWAIEHRVTVDELNGSSWLAFGKDSNLPLEFWEGFDYDKYIELLKAALINQVML